MPQVLETKAYTTGQGIAITLIVLDGLLVFALLAFYVVLALLQNKVNRRLTPLWLVTCALWAWALYYIFFIVQTAGTRATVVAGHQSEYVGFSTAYYTVAVVFENIAFDFIFAVLYGFIHLALKIATDGKSKSTYTKSSICHWILLGFIVAISIGDFLTYILGKSREWVTLQVANWTLRWVCSWEISAWAIFAFIKAKKLPSAVKLPFRFLLCASLCFSIMSFMWAIYLYSVYNERSPGIFYNSGKRAPSFLEVFLAAGTFSGIMGFCMKSAEISRLLEEKEATETRPKTQHLSEADSKQWIQEADSRTVMEAEASLPKGISTKRFVEADGSKPILEAGSRQIVEADSNQFYPRSKTSLEKKDSKDS